MLQTMDTTGATPEFMDDPQAWETLRDAHTASKAATSPAYDEVLNEVAHRIRTTGSIGKADIGALLFMIRVLMLQG
jgi:hypothetical protein